MAKPYSKILKACGDSLSGDCKMLQTHSHLPLALQTPWDPLHHVTQGAQPQSNQQLFQSLGKWAGVIPPNEEYVSWVVGGTRYNFPLISERMGGQHASMCLTSQARVVPTFPSVGPGHHNAINVMDQWKICAKERRSRSLGTELCLTAGELICSWGKTVRMYHRPWQLKANCFWRAFWTGLRKRVFARSVGACQLPAGCIHPCSGRTSSAAAIIGVLIWLTSDGPLFFRILLSSLQ